MTKKNKEKRYIRQNSRKDKENKVETKAFMYFFLYFYQKKLKGHSWQ